MPVYEVTVTRTETIIFSLTAADRAEAEANYLWDGDEVASETTHLSVLNVEEI